MSESDVIHKTKDVITKETLLNDFKALGIKKGDILLVHSSLSKLGWIVGREITVIDALLEMVGKNGTIVMPCFSGENSDPSRWENPPVPNSWVETIKENMPPFDPLKTPTREMGRIADAFWRYPNALRSNHPQVSFSAIGPKAEWILQDQPLSPGFGENSPLYKLYDLQAKVLLLGVGYGSCTCLHRCEVQLTPLKQYHLTGARIIKEGQSIWQEFMEIDYDDNDFSKLGEDYEKQYPVSIHRVGIADCRLIDMVSLCDFGKQWLQIHRPIHTDEKI